MDRTRHIAGMVLESKGAILSSAFFALISSASIHILHSPESNPAVLPQIMPWDSDIDVQVSEATMHFLANHYNMTEHSFKLEGVEKERKFLLEINPQFVVRHGDPANVIDARWIDMSSGLFIDITCVRKDYEERDKGNKGALMSKDRHKYNVCELLESF